MRISLPLLLGVSLALTARVGSAQPSVGDAAAYAALLSTPIAGVAPLASPTMTNQPQLKIGVDASYGRIGFGGGSINGYLGSLTIPMGDGRLAVSGGYQAASCESCSGNSIFGVRYEHGLTALVHSEATRLELGSQFGVGFAKPSDATVVAGSIGVPLSLAQRAGRTTVVAFATPAVGIGAITAGGDTESGARFLLGGGVGVLDIAPGVGLHVGFQKVFIDGGKTMLGAGLSWTGAR